MSDSNIISPITAATAHAARVGCLARHNAMAAKPPVSSNTSTTGFTKPMAPFTAMRVSPRGRASSSQPSR